MTTVLIVSNNRGDRWIAKQDQKWELLQHIAHDEYTPQKVAALLDHLAGQEPIRVMRAMAPWLETFTFPTQRIKGIGRIERAIGLQYRQMADFVGCPAFESEWDALLWVLENRSEWVLEVAVPVK